MPRQNRVLPTGAIVAATFRGTLMGNRGILHDADGRIVRPWATRRWIACRLAFKGRRRTVMAPGRYTELFFADEVTALAAGHRPCAECRRADYERFRDAWTTAFGGPRPSADAMDATLHSARLRPGSRDQRRTRATLRDLPDGVFVLDGAGRPALVGGVALRPQIDGTYAPPEPADPAREFPMLTPEPVVAVLRTGYVTGQVS